jgi:protease-4
LLNDLICLWNLPELLAIADGRVISGRQAVELGLVDGIGNYYDALDVAREMAGLSEDSPVELLNETNIWGSLGLRALTLLPNQMKQPLLQLRYE